MAWTLRGADRLHPRRHGARRPDVEQRQRDRRLDGRLAAATGQHQRRRPAPSLLGDERRRAEPVRRPRSRQRLHGLPDDRGPRSDRLRRIPRLGVRPVHARAGRRRLCAQRQLDDRDVDLEQGTASTYNWNMGPQRRSDVRSDASGERGRGRRLQRRRRRAQARHGGHAQQVQPVRVEQREHLPVTPPSPTSATARAWLEIVTVFGATSGKVYVFSTPRTTRHFAEPGADDALVYVGRASGSGCVRRVGHRRRPTSTARLATTRSSSPPRRLGARVYAYNASDRRRSATYKWSTTYGVDYAGPRRSLR